MEGRGASRWADVALRLPSSTARWSGPAFRAELRRWVADAVGEPRVLEPVKTRPWATVWRAETDGGVFFAKQSCSTQSYEAALVVTLNDLAARHVVPVTAAEPGRGLFLTPDLGLPLGDGSVDDWCRVVAAGAQLQLEVARYVGRLVATGLTVLEPVDCPAYVEERLDDFSRLPAADPRALPPERGDRVRALVPQVRAWAEEVAAVGLPPTLCHNDLHGRNVLEVNGELRLFDFADAMVTEPLAALLVPLNLLAEALGAGPDDPRLHRVADAALEVWSEHAPMAELRAVLPAALQLGRLARTESWIRCTAPMDDTELAEWGSAAGLWLASLGEPPPVDGAGLA
ncbi:aminoglycoside phosphotransferase family protein [Nocardioides sp.]|uniref:aminoglycoside phosphotransferase family protein n=1 Tax=Nocardioides sp. TaxID=35761 RepID=UPI0037848AE1